MPTKIKLKKAAEADSKQIFDLSNEENVRENSTFTDPINWDDHTKWFNDKLSDENYLILVVEDESDNFIGQVRYKIEKNHAIISISISPDFRGLDLAAPMIMESASYLFNNYDNVDSILAYIKEINIPSIKAFEQAGYIYHNQELINNVKFLVYRFLRN